MALAARPAIGNLRGPCQPNFDEMKRIVLTDATIGLFWQHASGMGPAATFLWEFFMKKLALVLAAAGLVSVAACSKPAETTTNETVATVDNTTVAADNAAMAMDNAAVAADNAANAMANGAAAMDNAAANVMSNAANATTNAVNATANTVNAM